MADLNCNDFGCLKVGDYHLVPIEVRLRAGRRVAHPFSLNPYLALKELRVALDKSEGRVARTFGPIVTFALPTTVGAPSFADVAKGGYDAADLQEVLIFNSPVPKRSPPDLGYRYE